MVRLTFPRFYYVSSGIFALILITVFDHKVRICLKQVQALIKVINEAHFPSTCITHFDMDLLLGHRENTLNNPLD